MSILPLEFRNGDTSASLNLTGKEVYSIEYNIYSTDKLATIKVNIHANIQLFLIFCFV
jgi:aconitase A